MQLFLNLNQVGHVRLKNPTSTRSLRFRSNLILNKNMDKKNPKSVPINPTSTTRLQSLKLPRDFTLGGSKPKKQYTPNLNVVRNKDKTKEYLKEVERKRKEKRSVKVDHSKSDIKKRFVQSSGVFSEGAADIHRPNTERRYTRREGEPSTSLILPKINRNLYNVNKKAEDVVLDELLNSNDDSEDDDELSFKPLHLMLNNHDRELKNVTKTEAEPDNTITYTHDLLPEPFNKTDIYNDESPHISIIKLPDSFAGKGLSDDPTIKKLFDYPLSDMLEGKIGELQIRKSGKMEVQIGNKIYQLYQKNIPDFEEHLVMIPNDKKDVVTIFGKIEKKFDLVPDFLKLLNKK